MPKRLSEKQNRFVDEYLKCEVGKDAVLRAGYNTKYPDIIGTQLLKNPKVIDALARRRRDIAGSTIITPEKVLIEFGRLAFSDIRDYLSWDEHGVTLIPSKDLTDNQARAIIEISETTTPKGTKTVRFKLANKVEALNSSAKLMGMIVEKSKVDVTVVHKYQELLNAMSLEDMRALAAEAIYNQGQRALGDDKVIEGTYTEQE